MLTARAIPSFFLFAKHLTEHAPEIAEVATAAAGPALRRSWECTASVKNSLSVRPSSAAAAFACRNNASGISMVVFTNPFSRKTGSPKGAGRKRPLYRGAAPAAFSVLATASTSRTRGCRIAVPGICARLWRYCAPGGTAGNVLQAFSVGGK
jgi:hypothetical protein